MNNFSNLLNFGFEFSKKYSMQYFKLLLKPIALNVLGILIITIIQKFPSIALLGLITIPLFCYAFWKGYLATFALNYAAISYHNSINEPLDKLVLKIKEKELASYLGFCAVIMLICYLPTIFYTLKLVNFSPNLAVISGFSGLDIIAKVFVAFLFNTLFLIPFLNFFNQAFLFKKENESYMDLFLNCYKKIDKDGLFLSIFFGFIGSAIGMLNPLAYAILALLLNLISFSANTLWFHERLRKESNIN